MRFAWQGLSLDVGADWHPVALTGSYQAGYARIGGPSDSFLQLRWETSSAVAGRATVDRYLDSLSRDFQREGHRFQRRVSDEHDIGYRYESKLNGIGALFSSEPSAAHLLRKPNRRSVILELTSPKSVSQSAFTRLLETFRFESDALIPWRLLGLGIRLPRELHLRKKELLAGKTSLEFSAGMSVVRAERWGLAEQLLERRDLQAWTCSAARIRNAESLESGADRVYLRARKNLGQPVYVMAVSRPEQNQITLVTAQTRKEEHTPRWNWFE